LIIALVPFVVFFLKNLNNFTLITRNLLRNHFLFLNLFIVEDILLYKSCRIFERRGIQGRRFGDDVVSFFTTKINREPVGPNRPIIFAFKSWLFRPSSIRYRIYTASGDRKAAELLHTVQ
jgi:hypothetical protein